MGELAWFPEKILICLRAKGSALVRAVVQRVSQASVAVSERAVGAISEPGLLVLVGITHADTPGKAAKLLPASCRPGHTMAR
jgi:hypothetical protein